MLKSLLYLLWYILFEKMTITLFFFLRHRAAVIFYIDVLYQSKIRLLEVFCRTFSFSLNFFLFIDGKETKKIKT